MLRKKRNPTVLNQLFLELSQIVTVNTDIEVRLDAALNEITNLLKEINIYDSVQSKIDIENIFGRIKAVKDDIGMINPHFS